MDTNRESSRSPERASIAPGPPPPARRRLGLLLALALVAVLAALGARAFLAREAPGARAASTGDAPASPGGERRDLTHPLPGEGAQGPVGGIEVGRSASLPRGEPKPFDESQLEGRGRIRGFVQAAPGVEFPLEWRLLARPSRALIGGERAEERTLEFHQGEQQFALEDLPFGGYALRAEAFGLSSAEQQILLSKPADVDVYVVMQLSLTGFVEGSVRFEDFTPAIGLELALEPRGGGPRAAAVTDELGHYLFTDVRTGAYQLHFGAPESPVREPLEVLVSGPAERLADVLVPKLAELIVRVLDPGGAPIAGATLDGWGEHGGKVAGTTDAQGEHRVRFLPPGRITVVASLPGGGSVQGRKVVAAGTLELLELVQGR